MFCHVLAFDSNSLRDLCAGKSANLVKERYFRFAISLCLQIRPQAIWDGDRKLYQTKAN